MHSSNRHQEIVHQLELIFAQIASDGEVCHRTNPPKITQTITWNQLNLWQTATKAISLSGWWQFCLIAFGSLISVIYPHPPLIAFAAVSGNTLTRNKALLSMTGIWLANQLYGFTVRHYPQTLESFTWGLVMGISILFVTWLMTLQPKFSRNNVQGYLIWLAVSVVGGFVIYQGNITLLAQLIGEYELSWTVLWGIFLKDIVWAIALSIFHGFILIAIALKLIKQLMK